MRKYRNSVQRPVQIIEAAMKGFWCQWKHLHMQSWQTKNQGYIFTKLLKLIDGGEACRLLRDIDKAWIFPWFPIYNRSVDTKHSTTTLKSLFVYFFIGKMKWTMAIDQFAPHFLLSAPSHESGDTDNYLWEGHRWGMPHPGWEYGQRSLYLVLLIYQLYTIPTFQKLKNY